MDQGIVVTDTINKRPPGRPRRFDAECAVETAQALFHARGYDGVSLTDLTKAFGINPPSFYASFGSKHGLFFRVLDRYAETGAIPFTDILRSDRPVTEGIIHLLEEAAHRYSADPTARGCLVLEGTHSNDDEARRRASAFHQAAEAMIHAYVAAQYPTKADLITDFVGAVMSGLSDKARSGHDLSRLLSIAHLAAVALKAELASQT